MNEIRIGGTGKNADETVESLWNWLENEPELRGHVKQGRLPVSEQDMGAAIEIVTTLTAASAVGVVTALTHSLKVWLTQQRADVTIEVTGPDGQKVTLSAQRVRTSDVESLLRDALTPRRTEG